MSRSHKKPFVKCGFFGSKRLANKKVRRYKYGISNGNSFKKIYESWDIVDYKQYSDDEKDRRK